MLHGVRQSVGWRLALWLLLSGCVLTVLLAWYEYRTERDRQLLELRNRLQHIQQAELPEIVYAAWRFDNQTLQLQMQSLCQHPYVARAEMRLHDGTAVVNGQPRAGLQQFVLPLHYTPAGQELGTLVLEIDLAAMRRDALAAAGETLGRDIILLLVSFVICLLLTRRFVTAPLGRLAGDIREGLAPAALPAGELADVAAAYVAVRQELQAQLEQQKQEFDLSLDLLIVAGFDGGIRQVNRAWQTTLGFDPKCLPGQRFFEFVHPDDISNTQQAMAALGRGEPVRSFVNRYRHRDGTWRSISWDAQALDNPRRVFAVGHDITAREEQLRELRESEDRYRRLVEALPHIVYIYHSQRGGVYYSAGVTAVFGLTPQQLLAQPTRWTDSIHPDDAPRVRDAIGRFLQGGSFDLEYRVRDAHGQWRWLRDRSIGRQRDGEAVLIECIATDITARKMSEALLREEQRFLHRVLDGMMPYAALLETDGTVLTVNRAPLDAGGLTELDVVGRKFWDCPWWTHDPEQAARVREMVVQAAGGREQRADLHMRIASDARQIIDLSLRPLRDEHGTITHLIASATDISERRAAEDSLRRSEERLQQLLRHSSDAIIVNDARGRTTFVSASMERISGYPAERFLGSVRGEEYHHPEDQPGIAAAFAGALAVPGRPMTVRYRLRHADGHWLHLEAVLCNLLDDPAVQGVLVNIRDISAQQQAQETLFHTEKLASLGRLAAGIAHEMNQPLNAIRNYCQGLLLNIEDGIPTHEEKIRANLIAAVQQVDRMAEIIRTMRVFTRRGAETGHERLPLERVIRYPLALLGAQLRSNNITLIVDPAVQEETLFISGNENRLQQVFINLFVFARDSILARRSAEPALIGEYRIELLRGDGTVSVRLSDNGRTISAADLPHIFEPFYARQDVEGSGLGLSICHEIVRQHDGTLTATSDSSGSVFIATFPHK